MKPWKAQAVVVAGLLVAVTALTFSGRVAPEVLPWSWAWVVVFGAISLSLGWKAESARRKLQVRLLALAVASAVALGGLWISTRLKSTTGSETIASGPIWQGKRMPPEARTPVVDVAALEACAKLQRWWWVEAPDGQTARALVEVLPGRDGTLALDATATRGLEESVFVPQVRKHKLARTPVTAGKVAVLEAELRRASAGVHDHVRLRVSCRPSGPKGIFGTLEYVFGKSIPSDEDVVPPKTLGPAADASSVPVASPRVEDGT